MINIYLFIDKYFVNFKNSNIKSEYKLNNRQIFIRMSRRINIIIITHINITFFSSLIII